MPDDPTTGGGFGNPAGGKGAKGGDSETEINVGLHLFEGAEHFQKFVEELKTANEQMRNLGQSRGPKDDIKAHKEAQTVPGDDVQHEIRDLLKRISTQINVFGADGASMPGDHPGVETGLSDGASLGKDTREDDKQGRQDLGKYANPQDPTIPTASGLKGVREQLSAVGRGVREGWKSGNDQWGQGSEWAQTVGPQSAEVKSGEIAPEKARGHKGTKLTGALMGAFEAHQNRSAPIYSGPRPGWEDDKNEEDEPGTTRRQSGSPQATTRDWNSLSPWERQSPEGQRQEQRLQKQQEKEQQRETKSVGVVGAGLGSSAQQPSVQKQQYHTSSASQKGEDPVVQRLDSVITELKGMRGDARTSPGQRGIPLPTPAPTPQPITVPRSATMGGQILEPRHAPAQRSTPPTQAHEPPATTKFDKSGQSQKQGGTASSEHQATKQESERFTPPQQEPVNQPRAGAYTLQNAFQTAAQKFEGYASKRERERGPGAAPISRAAGGLSRQAAAATPQVTQAKQYARQAHSWYEEHVKGPTQQGALEGGNQLSSGSVAGQNMPVNQAFTRGIGEKLNTYARAFTTPGVSVGQEGENKTALQDAGYMGGFGPWGNTTKKMRNSMDYLTATSGGVLDPQLSAQQMDPMVRFQGVSPAAAAQTQKSIYDTASAVGGVNPAAAQQSVAKFSQAQQQQGGLPFQTSQAGTSIIAGTGGKVNDPNEVLPAAQSGLGKLNTMKTGNLFAPGAATGGTTLGSAVSAIQQYGQIGKNMPPVVSHTGAGDIVDTQANRRGFVQSQMPGQSPAMIDWVLNKPGDAKQAVGQANTVDAMNALWHPAPGQQFKGNEKGVMDQVTKQLGPQATKDIQHAGDVAAGQAGRKETNKTPDSWVGAISKFEPFGSKPGNFLDKLLGGAGGGDKTPKQPSAADPKKSASPEEARQSAIENAYKSKIGMPPDKPGPPPKPGQGGGGASQQIDLTDQAKQFFKMIPNQQQQGGAQARAGQGQPNSNFAQGYQAGPGAGGGV